MVDGLLRLLSLSLSGALLTGGTALLARLLRGRISRTAAYYLWLPVLMRLLCPWGLSHTLMDRAVSSAVGEGIAVSVSLAPEEGADDPEHPSILPEVSGGETAAGAALYLWGAGFAAVAVWQGTGYFCLCRRLRADGHRPEPELAGLYVRASAGARRPPELLQSAAIPVPLVVGLLRSRILLPERELSPEQWEGVLTHELVHWRRHDLWIKWLAVLARAVHWFNPAVWWLVCRLEQDCELSCDEQTVRRWDSPRRARYGELLLILAAGGDSGFGGVSLSLSSPKQRLKERLICMMTQKRYGRPAALLAASAGLAVVLSSAALGAYAGPAHQTAPASEETPEALSWPLETDGSVTLSALYGSRVHPVTGKTTSHSGIDIPRDAGTPVLAAADGTVEEAGFDAEDGRYVVLRHGSLTTKYCHLQEVDAAGGEQVQTGDAIGRVGSTGQSTGPHLHFEVALDGAAQDPLSYLEHTGTDVL